MHRGIEATAPEAVAIQDVGLGISDLIALLRRRLKLILLVLAGVVGLVMVYVVEETPRYTATAAIVLDNRKARPNEEIAGLSNSGADQATAESQVEVIKSESVALAVIEKLKLDEDPSFYGTKSLFSRLVSSAVQSIRAQIGQGSEAAPVLSPRIQALETLKDRLSVERVGSSYVINVSYASHDPQRAAVIANAVIEAYRAKQIEARESDSQRTTNWLRTRLDEFRQQSLKVDFEIQQLRQNDGATPGSRTLVLLRDLEREAETYKKLYQTFLARYQQAIELEILPIDEARVISAARPPLAATFPNKTVFLAIALFLGTGLGVALALFVDLRDRSVRTASDVTDDIGLPYLGMLPILSRPRFDFVQREPRSLYAETLKSLRVRALSAVPAAEPKVIGFCSVLPSEGKSFVASNFAFTLKNADTPALLIDGDVRNRTLSRTFFPKGDATGGPADAVKDLAEKLQFASIATGAKNEPQHIGDFPERVARFTDRTADTKSWTVLDLPPLGIADVGAVAHLLDYLVLVVEWGRVSTDAIRSAIETQPEIRDKCLGVLLNSVDLKKLRLYDRDGISEAIDGLNGVYFQRA